jgi:EAL domain-containing protein (putative c-di-GMP-specific phosphodiesterase class I)/CheY-like chemotaxis protein
MWRKERPWRSHRGTSMSKSLYPNSRILVVDDEAVNVDLLTKMLSRAGYDNVASTSDSGKAMRLVKTFEPDLIVLDLHMPEPDGFTIMSELNETFEPDEFLPVLVLTADATEITKVRALGDGATDFLTKPFEYPELLLRLQNLLTIRQQHQQLRRANISMATTIEEQKVAAAAHQERERAITLRTEAVLAAGGPKMVYQPIVDLSDGSLVGVEALARFAEEPHDGPEMWFIEAHEVHLGIQLELSALSVVLQEIDQLPPDCDIALNVSPETLRSPALRHVLRDAPAERIVLELTEHERVQDYPELVASLTDLRERGMRIAVDDTGSGFSSLQHILEIRPDIVKLDRSLIMDLDASPVRRSLVASLFHFSTEVNLTLVAEGIESIGELEAVTSLGIRHGQGFLLANPSELPVPIPQLPT